MNMSLRLAAAGDQVGLSEAQILGFAAALSSVGVRAGDGRLSVFQGADQHGGRCGHGRAGVGGFLPACRA